MEKSNLKSLFFIVMFIAATPLFASIVPPGLEKLGDEILVFFLGPIVRIILICCVAGCAIAYGFNKDNDKMKRNMVAIGISIAVLACAQGIVEAVWKASLG